MLGPEAALHQQAGASAPSVGLWISPHSRHPIMGGLPHVGPNHSLSQQLEDRATQPGLLQSLLCPQGLEQGLANGRTPGNRYEINQCIAGMYEPCMNQARSRSIPTRTTTAVDVLKAVMNSLNVLSSSAFSILSLTPFCSEVKLDFRG